MGLLYRTPVFITRNQPFIEWANGLDADGPDLTVDLAKRREVYLVPTPEHDPGLEEVLDEWWADIFEEELFGWTVDESTWPAGRTREMFDTWFDTEIGDCVVDLTPEEPLTDADLDREELDVAQHTCAWCERELEAGEGRYTGFTLKDRERLKHREGLALSLVLDEHHIVLGIITPAQSEEGRAGDDIVFKVCSRACEQPLKKLVPPALRKLFRT